MISLHTAFMDKLDNNLINFRKMVQLSVIFQSLNDLQNSESPVVANTNGYLEVLQVALEMFYCENCSELWPSITKECLTCKKNKTKYHKINNMVPSHSELPLHIKKLFEELTMVLFI